MASIRRRPNGAWRARYRDDEGKEHSRHFPRQKDAQAWLDGITTSVLTGSYVDPRAGRVTLASFYADWADRQVWEPTTRRAMDTAIRGCTFVDVELGKLRRSHVESWVKTMTKTLAPSTIKTRVANIRAVLRGAVRDRLMSADPSEGVVLPRVRRAEHAMRIPTTEEVGRLLEAAEDWLKPLVALCAFAGLRIGEASAVQVRDIQFLRRQLYVARQVQGGGQSVEISPPKYGSERNVFIPARLAELLARHIESVGVHGDDEWLLPGNPPSSDSLRYWFGKATAVAGLADVTAHDLRHFYASGLIAAGCDVVTVQRALGHAKATTTLNIYAHLWPTAEDRTRNAAADLMDAALDASADSLRTGNSKKA